MLGVRVEGGCVTAGGGAFLGVLTPEGGYYAFRVFNHSCSLVPPRAVVSTALLCPPHRSLARGHALEIRPSKEHPLPSLALSVAGSAGSPQLTGPHSSCALGPGRRHVSLPNSIGGSSKFQKRNARQRPFPASAKFIGYNKQNTSPGKGQN